MYVSMYVNVNIFVQVNCHTLSLRRLFRVMKLLRIRVLNVFVPYNNIIHVVFTHVIFLHMELRENM